ncbi:MAG: GDP-L-fucose synthase [Bacteroidota bacterium]
MEQNAKIYIAGHLGMVGSAIHRNLQAKGYSNFLTRSLAELDLSNQQSVNDFFANEKPDYVFLAAAKVGGIMANNTYRAQFIYENLMIQNNIIHAAYVNGVKKLLFLGSSCIYPKLAPQPLKEESLLTGLLEYTNEPYAIAKIAGIKMCESYYRQYGCNFISVMPTNLYGPNDNYNLETSHVLPALIHRMHNAKVSMEEQKLNNSTLTTNYSLLTLWGTGTPLREFLYVEDMADACVFLMQNLEAEELYNSGITHINIGSGEEITIKDLAELIRSIVGFEGEIQWDATKPDGTPRKLMDESRLHTLGWIPTTSLPEGIKKAYQDFLTRQG